MDGYGTNDYAFRMRTRRFSGRVIGLLAAYLVALQALVLPLSVPTAPAFATGLCLSDHDGHPASHPADQDGGCPCCAGCGLQCHVPALPAGPGAALILPRLRVAAIERPAPAEAPARPHERGPQVARGPPSV